MHGTAPYKVGANSITRATEFWASNRFWLKMAYTPDSLEGCLWGKYVLAQLSDAPPLTAPATKGQKEMDISNMGRKRLLGFLGQLETVG